jgi:hypothetical protein
MQTYHIFFTKDAIFFIFVPLFYRKGRKDNEQKAFVQPINNN